MEQRQSSTRPEAGGTIFYGVHPSPFGRYLLALTPRGEVCALTFVGSSGIRNILARLKKHQNAEKLVRDEKWTRMIANTIFTPRKKSATIPIVLYGTDFEMSVWNALLQIAEGQVMTYSQIAEKIKSPKATRAVGTACGKNAIAYLIPCHRAVPKGRGIGRYRWGVNRKKALLAWEISRV